MSESEEELDISKAINLDSDSSDSEDSNSDREIQDEILSSDEDDKPVVKIPKKTPTAQTTSSFPSLELSGDEDSQDDNEYFTAPKTTKKLSSGTFAGLGLTKVLLKNISKKGFKSPTPIQRKTVPIVLQGRDVVGMARTGSGKTAAFVLPMIQKLKAHSAKVGARAMIMSPSRELALQTLKIVKEFSKGTDLRSVLLVGGDSLEDQFGFMMNNPDIIIATPGRFLHLKVEMQLDLKTIEYIVFDEADRLFEMGFSEQLNEILASLAPERQTLLFSATLPKSLVEFAKAGLQDAVLIRLDTDTKIPEDLEMAFFSIKESQRDAALVYILEEIIKMPAATEEQKQILNAPHKDSSDDDDDDNDDNKKKYSKSFKRPRLPPANELPSPFSTIVFTPTKHHVEYVTSFLRSMGYAVSYIYSSLDQTARKEQLLLFRTAKTTIMVVTDIAARGIDIPVLANVINYSLPTNPKIFIHRVGRTARAGRRGWAYSLVKEPDIPYLLDLELFLGTKLLLTSMYSPSSNIPVSYTDRLVLGALPRESLEVHEEEVDNIVKRDYDIKCLKDVAAKAERHYKKTMGAASHESVKRSKELIASGWDQPHLLFGQSLELERRQFLDRLANRRDRETVFEYKNKSETLSKLMERRRQQIAPIQRRALERQKSRDQEKVETDENKDLRGSEVSTSLPATKVSEEELAATFETSEQVSKKRKRPESYKDPNFYISHYAPSDAAQDRGYSINNGSGNFMQAAAGATFDLTGEGADFVQKQGMKWDKKKGKYINAGSQDASGKPVKFIRGEGGTKLPASYRSGRFESWKSVNKTSGPRVGSLEDSVAKFSRFGDNKFKHSMIKAPKPADRARDDYYVRKKRVQDAVEKGLKVKGMTPKQGSGLQTTDQVRKARELKDRRKNKNARPRKSKRN